MVRYFRALALPALRHRLLRFEVLIADRLVMHDSFRVANHGHDARYDSFIDKLLHPRADGSELLRVEVGRL